MGKVRKRKSQYPLKGLKAPVITADQPLSEIEAELKSLGLPLNFHSTKGEHIQGQINVEAARVGQIRKYQQFQGKKLKEWQIRRLKGIRLKQAKAKAKQKNT